MSKLNIPFIITVVTEYKHFLEVNNGKNPIKSGSEEVIIGFYSVGLFKYKDEILAIHNLIKNNEIDDDTIYRLAATIATYNNIYPFNTVKKDK